jgi:protein-disulfide isomerase
MRYLLTAATAGIALMLAGCGGQEGGNDSTTAATGTPAPVVPAPNGGDWTQTVSATAEGGFVMGNPNAPVKLVEYGSLTCPHCADFSENGQPKLIDQYVKTGKVSYEFRNFVRDAADLAVSLLSRCGGATPYFKLTDQLFATQADWFAKLQQMTPAEQQQLQGLSPSQMTGALAERAGLVQFVQLRGIPAEKARTCLADQAEIDKLVAMNKTAVDQHNLSGTPTFIINGSTVDNAASWETLEPKLRAAVG